MSNNSDDFAQRGQAAHDATAASSIVDWTTLIGHARIESWLGAAIRGNRLGGSFLFVGSPGVGKQTVARLLARTLFCQRSAPSEMSPCGQCPACQQVLAGTHPDLVEVAKPAEKSEIPLDLLIGPPDARMQEGFCRDLRMRPRSGGRKVAILHDADFLNEEGANCLLKTLEEPPSGAVVMLIGTSEQKQLPTIRSRCQIVRLGPLNLPDTQALLQRSHSISADDDQVAAALQISGGDIKVTARLLDGQSNQLRETLGQHLAAAHPDPVKLSRYISETVDQSGKEARIRRSTMRDIFSVCIQHYRHQMRCEASENTFDPRTLARLDRSIRAIREIERNANQSSLIECFSADIAAAQTGDRGQIG